MGAERECGREAASAHEPGDELVMAAGGPQPPRAAWATQQPGMSVLTQFLKCFHETGSVYYVYYFTV